MKNKEINMEHLEKVSGGTSDSKKYRSFLCITTDLMTRVSITI